MKYHLLLASIVALTACDDGMDDPDAGFDAGRVEIDSGPGDEDAGMDAGMEAEDAGMDGGMMMSDAGMDTGMPDAGMDAGPDAGALGPMVVINEVTASDALGGADWIEFYNAGDRAADISGWYFHDNNPTGAGRPYTFPAGTTIAPGAFLVLSEDATGATGPAFGFSASNGDEAHLFDSMMTERDMTSYGPGQADPPGSWGRSPNGTGSFATLAAQTMGLPNP